MSTTQNITRRKGTKSKKKTNNERGNLKKVKKGGTRKYKKRKTKRNVLGANKVGYLLTRKQYENYTIITCVWRCKKKII